jgi:hypothetical protein
MRRFARLVAFFAILAPAGAATAELSTWRFTWEGAGGYRIEGRMAFDAAHLSRPELRADDIACFVIEGFHGDRPIGRWALGQRGPATTWILTFLPTERAFAVYGPDHPMPQAWNMDGFGTDCGPGGFGFNVGNWAQDICVDGRLIVASQVAPSQPLPAVPAPGLGFPPDACPGDLLIGLRRGD